MLRVIFWWTFALMALGTNGALAETRVALIIGNGAYQNEAKLPNPTRDATAIAELFKSAGFEVVQARNDLSNLDFKRALREFYDVSYEADIALVYYAGHAIQVGDENYMIPVDAKLIHEYDAEDEAIALERIVKAVSPAKRLRVVILDACRDNPFAAKMQRRVATRQIVSRGLARVEPTYGDTLIAYAAKAGSTAEDGEGEHSPFTTALLRHLGEPGLDIRLAFGRVRDDVLQATRNTQEPFVYGTLGGRDITLVPGPPKSAGQAPSADLKADYELVERINSTRAWEVFIETHKTGYYVDLARERLRLLENTPAAPEPAKQNPKIATAGEKTAERDSVAVLRRFIESHPNSPLVVAAKERLSELERSQKVAEVKRSGDEEQARKTAEAEAQRKADEERARKEAEAKAQADAEKARKAAEAAEVKRKADEEQTRKEAEAKAQAEAEKARKAAEAEAKRKADEEQARQQAEAKAQAAAAAAKKADEENTRREAEAKAQAEAEKARKAAEAEAKRKADEERAQKEAAAKAQAEAEKAKKAAEAEAKRKTDEERAQKAAEQAEAEKVRKAAEAAETKRKADEERSQKEAEAKAQAEAEKARKAAEKAEAKRKADEEQARKEAEAKALAEADKARQADEERARKDAEAKTLAEADNARKAAEVAEAKRKADEEKLAALQPQAPTDETARRNAPPTNEQRIDFIKQAQRLLNDCNCYSGDINGKAEDLTGGLDLLTSNRSDARPIEIASANIGQFEDWLAWMGSVATEKFTCPEAGADKNKREQGAKKQEDDEPPAAKRKRTAQPQASSRKPRASSAPARSAPSTGSFGPNLRGTR